MDEVVDGKTGQAENRPINDELYYEAALRTDLSHEKYKEALERILGCKLYLENQFDTEVIEALHAMMGLVTEAGELCDIFKRFIFYGKQVDKNHVAEEAGDIDWYRNKLQDYLMKYDNGTTRQQVLTKNIKKLMARYPEKFDEDKAINRDLEAETNIINDVR